MDETGEEGSEREVGDVLGGGREDDEEEGAGFHFKNYNSGRAVS